MKRVKLLALVAAIATGVLLFFYLNALDKPAEEAKTAVLVAVADIPANTPIREDMVEQRSLPTAAVVAGAAFDPADVVGKISQGAIYAGEQILSKKLILPGGENGTLAYSIEPGMRAVSIGVTETSGVAYLLMPGNHVDILAYYLKDDGTTKMSYSTSVMENITVLAVDQSTKEESGMLDAKEAGYTTVTLQVTPEQALELNLAQAEGKLIFTLRSPLDEQKTNLPSVAFDKIIVK